jgi:hypothetical protein
MEQKLNKIGNGHNATFRHVHITAVALAILRANHIFYVPYYIFICGLCGCTIFSTLSHKWHNFQGKKSTIEHKM